MQGLPGGGLWHIGAARDPHNSLTHLVYCQSDDLWPHSQHERADCGVELDWTVITTENLCQACLDANVVAGRIAPAAS